MTLSDPNPSFKVTVQFKGEYLANGDISTIDPWAEFFFKSLASLWKIQLKFRLAVFFSADIFMANFLVEPNF